MKAWHKICLFSLSSLLAVAVFLYGQEGPNREGSTTVAKPRKKDAGNAESDLPKIPSRLNNKNKEEAPDVSFKVDTNVVNVDVAVLDNKGHFIPKIPRGNFRILEDNVPQQISNFSMGEAPMTICMVIEFSNKFQRYWGQAWYETLSAAYGFVETLKPEDYVAVVAYDIKPEILSDFSTDRRKTQEALSRLRIAAWSEANLYKALVETADRMTAIEGRKAIVLISSGIDTGLGEWTFDKTRRKMQDDGIPIYAFGLMQTLRELMDAYGMMGPISRLDFLQADNQMRTFAKETGGMAFFPRFMGEYPGIFQQIAQSLRNQYSLGYSPSNQAKDGKFRKIKVELINPTNNEPLRVVDEKGKPIKYQIVAKAGYTAPRVVE